MWLGSSYVVYAFLGNEVLGQASIFSTPSSPGKRGVLGQASIFSTPSSPGKRGVLGQASIFYYTVIPAKAGIHRVVNERLNIGTAIKSVFEIALTLEIAVR